MTRAIPLHVVYPFAHTARAAERAPRPAYQPFGDHPPTVVDDALERVVASKTFRRSQRHQEFLHHVVRAALDGRHEELKEVVIGIEVFGRDISTYDPRQDPIVRVEAGRVREKLARYYADEGSGDAFEIQLPLGGYLPRLAGRSPGKAPPRNLGSIAVLPFANLSSVPEDAIFSAGLADQLIDMLSRVSGLRVVGRMSAFKVQARGLDLKTAGKLLGVTSVLEGSVQRAGSRYRCIAQLFRTRDQACIWSERFECAVGDGTDLFAFQDRIGEAVLAAVLPAASSPEAPVANASHRAGTGNVEARDLFERGRYLEQQRTIEGWQKAIPLFERAVALDPAFASAYSHLGACLGHVAGMMCKPTVPAFREVERHARRALELDPLDGDARAVIANIVFRIELDWARAEPMFREALRVAPSSAMAHNVYGGGLVFNGRPLEAIEHGRIALDLDPLNVSLRANYAVICSYARDFATSIDEFLAVLEFDADHLFANVMLGMAYLWSGRDVEAMRLFERSVAIAPDHPAAWFCRILVHGVRGETERGTRELQALVERLGDTRYAQFNLAMAYAYLGDRPSMYATLQRVADAREVLFVSLPADPSFDPYRDEPAFIAFMDRYGLSRLPPSPFLTRR